MPGVEEPENAGPEEVEPEDAEPEEVEPEEVEPEDVEPENAEPEDVGLNGDEPGASGGGGSPAAGLAENIAASPGGGISVAGISVAGETFAADRVPRASPISSAGRAGMSVRVMSASAPRASSWPEASAGPTADGMPVTGGVAVSLAGTSLAAPAPLAGVVVTGTAPAAGVRGVRLGGAGPLPDAEVSPSLSSSSPAHEVTMVGEAPPEPSGLLVRLSKPSSL